MSFEDKALYPPIAPSHSGMRGLCPRCGQGRLFDGYLKVAPRCANCGLDFSFADSADGPAVFIMLVVGFIVVGLALLVEFAFHPPYWLHALLWVPLTLALALGALRPVKGWLIAQQYVKDADPGRIEPS
jgi:uncharacterized protein (DUF983 family)